MIAESIIKADQQLFLFLNNLGSAQWDFFWMEITKGKNWIPLFIVWIFLLFKNYHWKKALQYFLLIGVMAGFSDQLCNVIKNTVQRPRPCWQEGVMEYARILECTHSFSYLSAHATTSVAVVTYLVFLFRKKYNWIWVFYVWPLLFAYSRIYIGKHYPLDIVSGAILGFGIAVMFRKITDLIENRNNKKSA